MKRLPWLCVALAACGGGSYHPKIDASKFGSAITNPYFPLTPGTSFEHRVEDDGQLAQVTFSVTHEKRQVMGVSCTVVRDVNIEQGVITEDTFDWFAQDEAGNVWYFGEDTTAFHDGKADKAGSWEAGVNGAQPGIVMKAAPAVGDAYRQEYLFGEAEDEAEVLSVDEAVTVPYGAYEGCIRTRDFTRLQPNLIENKLYCRGVGNVLTLGLQGSNERAELIRVTDGTR